MINSVDEGWYKRYSEVRDWYQPFSYSALPDKSDDEKLRAAIEEVNKAHVFTKINLAEFCKWLEAFLKGKLNHPNNAVDKISLEMADCEGGGSQILKVKILSIKKTMYLIAMKN